MSHIQQVVTLVTLVLTDAGRAHFQVLECSPTRISEHAVGGRHRAAGLPLAAGPDPSQAVGAAAVGGTDRTAGAKRPCGPAVQGRHDVDLLSSRTTDAQPLVFTHATGPRGSCFKE